MYRYYPTVVGIAIALHLIWAVGLIADPQAIHATALHAMLAVTGSSIASAGVFAAVATLAVVGMVAHRVPVRVILILPQHLVLWISVAGEAYAMWLGQFADGTIRSHWFLIVDQVPVILIACGHTAALLFITAERQDDGQR
ncbi:MAG: hypothetical protein KF723_22250 [Rhizobiaceae bacterium]|nr:hypothetical protein [Rhizobiaceae bacterium]